MSFDQQIKEWVQLDNQLKILNEKVKEVREKRHGLNNTIMDYISKNNSFHTNINLPDGKLKFTQTNSATPLTFKYVEKCLGEVIRNENQVKQIVDYIRSKREIKTSYEIKRISNN
jgi:Xaa-Pro aminopeptidase